LKLKVARFIWPSVRMWTVRTLRPAGSFSVAALLRRFQWCHWRQATGSALLKVLGMVMGAVGTPLTSSEMVPLAGFGPADVELAVGWGDEVVGVVVDGDFGVVELGVGRVDAFVHAELVEVGSVGGVELAGAVIDGVGVVVGNAFAAYVVVGALNDAGDGLGADGVVRVGERSCADGGRGSMGGLGGGEGSDEEKGEGECG